MPWTAHRTNRLMLEETKLAMSLEAQIMTLGLSYFGHTVRRERSLGKEMFGKIEGTRRRGGGW